jgi:SAM-dependent methyltransferase
MRQASDRRDRAARAAARAPGAEPLPGMVEEFERRDVAGWVQVPAGSPPVRVGLYINDFEAVGTWAVDPAGRRGRGEVRGFRFRLYDVWRFTKRTDRVSVRIDGRPLPIYGKGMFYRPRADGEESVEQLAQRFAAGEVFGQNGRIQKSKTVDTQWQAEVLELYTNVRAAVREEFGYDAFLLYGSLLGAVREGGFIGHDLDFDSGYVSRHRDGPAAARELQQIAYALIKRGYTVHCKFTCLHVSDERRGSARIDLFHLYFDAEGVLRFPFGVAGTTRLTETQWSGTTEIDFVGHKVAVPAAAEAMVEHIYGASWRTPNPAFRWERDRTQRAAEGILTETMIEAVYWAGFYARTTFTSGSSFFELVNSREQLPTRVVDLGCGDGRDSFAFARAGRRVLGLDRSQVGVDHASAKAAELGQSGQVRFAACDVADAEALRALLDSARADAPEEPVLFYARFFLHSIPEATQHTLLAVVADCARPGDVFAAEFRTDRDEQNAKVYGRHYRRFQNGPQFGRDLAEKYGFAAVVLEQEGNGFSPYQGEDPVLYRVIATRSPGA